MALETATQPYLRGHYAPVHDELVADDLVVTGTLPPSLRGAYLRNGPNPQFPPLGGYHIFDGDGMVHAVELDEGRARYRNRWIESAGLLAERRAGRALFGGLSEFRLPDPDVVAEVGMMKNTANTSIVRHADRILALMEAAKPTELSIELETLGEWDFDGALTGPMTAHPKTDPDTGALVFFGYSPFPPFLTYHVADESGVLTTSIPIDLPSPVMMHDFAVSRDKAAFFDLPAIFDVEAMLAGEAGIRWDPSNGARIGVLDRRRPQDGVRWVEVEPFYMFHVLNAHDEGDTIVVEGCRADRLNAAFGPDRLDEPVAPHLHRWRIDATEGSFTEEALDDRAGDFPRIDDRRAGLPARYGYVAHSSGWTETDPGFDGVVKHDLQTGSEQVHRYGDDCVSGEAVFAPDPERDGEDDGWLLNLVHDRVSDRSSLVVLDAPTMEEVARVQLPRRVPFGFHGSLVGGRLTTKCDDGAVAVALTREIVIRTARAQLEEQGADQLSLRGVARALGVTAPALYAYVEDKQELLAAIATEHFERLVERFEAVEATDPVDRIRALSQAYVDHALSSPALFRLMFRFPPAPVAEADPFPPAARAFEMAAAATAEAIEAGQLAVDDATMASMTMWTAVHGLAEVLLMGFGFDQESADALRSSVIDTVLAGQMRAQR